MYLDPIEHSSKLALFNFSRYPVRIERVELAFVSLTRSEYGTDWRRPAPEENALLLSDPTDPIGTLWSGKEWPRVEGKIIPAFEQLVVHENWPDASQSQEYKYGVRLELWVLAAADRTLNRLTAHLRIHKMGEYTFVDVANQELRELG